MDTEAGLLYIGLIAMTDMRSYYLATGQNEVLILRIYKCSTHFNHPSVAQGFGYKIRSKKNTSPFGRPMLRRGSDRLSHYHRVYHADLLPGVRNPLRRVDLQVACF